MDVRRAVAVSSGASVVGGPGVPLARPVLLAGGARARLAAAARGRAAAACRLACPGSGGRGGPAEPRAPPRRCGGESQSAPAVRLTRNGREDPNSAPVRALVSAVALGAAETVKW